MTNTPGDTAAYAEALDLDKLPVGQRVTFETTTGHACGAVIGYAHADDMSSGDGRPMVLVDLDKAYRGYIAPDTNATPAAPEIYVSMLVAAPGNLTRIATCAHCGREIEEADDEWGDLGAVELTLCYDEADTIPTDEPSDQRHEPAPVTR